MISRKQNIQTGFLVEREYSNGNKHDPVRYVIVDSLESTLVVKVKVLKRKSANQPQTHSNQLAQIQCRASLNHSQSLMASNFAAL